MAEGTCVTPRYIVVTPTMQFLWLDPVWAPLLACSEVTPQEILEIFSEEKTFFRLWGLPTLSKMDAPYSHQDAVSSKECATACSPTILGLSFSVTDKVVTHRATWQKTSGLTPGTQHHHSFIWKKQ